MTSTRQFHTDEVAARMQTDLAWLEIEVVRVLYGDGASMILADDLAAVGTVDEVRLPMRDIVRRGLALDAATFILIHNHPSDDPRASESDVTLTRRLVDLGNAIQLRLREHLVVARRGHSRIRYSRMI